MHNLEQEVKRLIAQQTVSWETARKNYATLANIQSKRVNFDGFYMEVQFNPERARSTTASTESAVKRPCFLCAANRPPEQKFIHWREYEILVNPYPIFNPHLTIPAVEHTPQFLTGKIRDMVDLSAELPDFVLTFNGARSGASAPDHFHFQAVGKNALPTQKELPEWKQRSVLYTSDDISVWGANDYLRSTIVVEGKTADQTAHTAENVLADLKGIMQQPDEAQINALAWCDSRKYTIVFFPRTGHRPRQYYAEGEEQFLSSPGAVDLAGVFITVREQDYQRISAPLIDDLFSQVVPDSTQWERIKTEISLCLAKNRK